MIYSRVITVGNEKHGRIAREEGQGSRLHNPRKSLVVICFLSNILTRTPLEKQLVSFLATGP